MPIVSVQLFPGRTATMKELLARAIVDAVSELAGPPREAVQAFFVEVTKDDWAIGPTLVSSRAAAPPPAHVPALVSAIRLRPKEGERDAYVAWRRDSLLPFLAAQEGFLSSTLLAADDTGDELLAVYKWVSPEVRERFRSLERAAELHEEEQRFLDGPAVEVLTGRVVDVLHGRT